MRPRKVLAIQFKFLGDVVVATPALRALKEFLGKGSELHVLVPQEAAALLAHVSWIDRVWKFPRKRDRADLRTSYPLVRALRAERFDVSIDLAGNDRGAILTRLIGARKRLGVMLQRGHQLRRLCYTETIEELDSTRHETVRAWAPVSLLGVPLPSPMRMEIRADPAYSDAASEYLRGAEVLCFITASLPKKEWPLRSWLQFHRMASASGIPIAYTGGHTPREREMLEQFRREAPAARVLDPAEPLELLVAALAQLKGVVVGDTGPLHFAAGLGIPTLSLFGPTSATQWAPLGEAHVSVQGGLCSCSGHIPRCVAPTPCIDAITPERVYDAFVKAFGLSRPHRAAG